MDVSFLIVTKHRAADLKVTLDRLKTMIDLSLHEVLVLIDGCTETEALVAAYPWVQWTVLKESVSASPARAILYPKAKGTILIGLDDDAHPLTVNFITTVQSHFDQHPKVGIIAFKKLEAFLKPM